MFDWVRERVTLEMLLTHLKILQTSMKYEYFVNSIPGRALTAKVRKNFLFFVDHFLGRVLVFYFFFSCFLDRFLGRVLLFLFSYFHFINSHLRHINSMSYFTDKNAYQMKCTGIHMHILQPTSWFIYLHENAFISLE